MICDSHITDLLFDRLNSLADIVCKVDHDFLGYGCVRGLVESQEPETNLFAIDSLIITLSRECVCPNVTVPRIVG